METKEMMEALADEYAVQYFSFLPQHFLNGVYNVIVKTLMEAFDALYDTVLNKYKDSVSEDQVMQMSNKLKKKAVERLDEKFDRAQLYLLGNVLKVPDSVVLPEDRIHVDSPCTEEEMAELDQQIKDVIERIEKSKIENMELSHKLKRIDKLQKQFDKSLQEVIMTGNRVNAGSIQVNETINNLGLAQKELQCL